MIRSTTMIAALALAAGLTACKKDEQKTEAPAQPTAAAPAAAAPAPEQAVEPTGEIGKVSPEELKAWIAANEVAVLDSNGDSTRKEHGKIPSATLLSSYTDYDLAELPAEKDKKLVFYCSNTQCGASKKSAGKALAAGYTDVNILPAGVIGWKQAGLETEAAM
ncbi:MAG TPA: rhodanese-like domain-containing protein [Kofleriaceae bacterium]|nr:rhodanese-like domain-containing protein [Kofleriaceae bacterium]